MSAGGPAFSQGVRFNPGDHLVCLRNPTGYEAEQYRTLRHGLQVLRQSRRLQVIAITSPGVGDGKTTTAINLAASLAHNRGNRVLVVDADLRRPAILDRLGVGAVQRMVGLADLALDPALPLKQALCADPGYNLVVLPAGSAVDIPYEILISPHVATRFEEARREFDVIIVDTPPAAHGPDFRAIEAFVDGVLLVVAAHRTPRTLGKEAVACISPQRLLGVVYNGDTARLPRHYYTHYMQRRQDPPPTSPPASGGVGNESGIWNREDVAPGRNLGVAVRRR